MASMMSATMNRTRGRKYVRIIYIIILYLSILSVSVCPKTSP